MSEFEEEMSYLDKVKEAKKLLNQAQHSTHCKWCREQIGKVEEILDLLLEAMPLASKILDAHEQIATISAEVKQNAQKLKSE